MKALFLIFALAISQKQDSTTITGKWLWQGAAGWQRIGLDLKADGSKLSGVIRMGPGAVEPQSPADFWEYFFDPTDFKIANGKIQGDTVYFEHEAQKSIPPILNVPSPLGFLFVTPNIPPAYPIKFVYRGLIEGNRIALTRETLSRRDDLWILGHHKVSFDVERVK